MGSTCTAFSDQTQHCLKSCRVGSAECRYGYACAPVADGGVCLPRCYADPDCVDAARFQCRICDGLCVPKQSPSGQVGDPCSADATCGAGQRCVKTDPRFAQRSCTEPCGSGCGNCPTGSSCHVLAGGALYCLKTCTGLHTCPTGMRCEDLSAGKACMPGCLGAGDCAADEDCVAGECVAPEDPGCGASCEPVDAGKPTGGKKDAGSGGGGGTASTGGGCGCGASPASLPWIWMPLTCFALSLVAQRRRLRVRA